MKLRDLWKSAQPPAGVTAAATPEVVEPPEDFDLIADPSIRIEKSGHFRLDDIGLIAQTYETVGMAPNSAWDHFRGKQLLLPDKCSRRRRLASNFRTSSRLRRQIGRHKAASQPCSTGLGDFGYAGALRRWGAIAR